MLDLLCEEDTEHKRVDRVVQKNCRIEARLKLNQSEGEKGSDRTRSSAVQQMDGLYNSEKRGTLAESQGLS